jgi:hypothetical protein
MLRNTILVLAGLATVAGALVANPQNAWARRRCCCGGSYGGYYGSSYYGSSGYGYSAAYPQTYDGGTAVPAPADGTNYGTNYGPQGIYNGAPGAQGYYDNAGVWRAYGPAGATVQGGAAVQGNVDAQGRLINPNQAVPRANAGVREDGSARTNIQANPGTGATRGNSGTGRTNTNVDGNVRSSTGAKVPPPPPTPAAPPAVPEKPSTPPREE